jgi:hypothetical protein
MKEKALIVIICLIGILAVVYGMVNRNNSVFIIGLVLVIGGYLLIRKKLKKSI